MAADGAGLCCQVLSGQEWQGSSILPSARRPPVVPACSDREKFMSLSAFSLVVIFFLTSVGSTLFYALGLSLLLISAHAALHVPDDLFLDEVPEQQSGGFLSLLTGGSKPAAAVVASAV